MEIDMPDKFIQVTDDFFVSPQIDKGDIAAAETAGFTLIVNNRPDGEASGQPESAHLEAAARAAGLAYAHIPVDKRGISPDHIDAFLAASRNHPGKTLAFCRSGTRAIILNAYAAARDGAAVDDLIASAAAAGYDIAPHRTVLEALAKRAAQAESHEQLK
jgi:uncharacterized protein (TIGR01244 family)